MQAVEAVERAGRDVYCALQRAIDQLAVAKDLRCAGRPLGDMVDVLMAPGGRESRSRVAEAFEDYERAVGALRGAVVRELVDEQGQTFTNVAERIGVSRTIAARLYRNGGPDGPATEAEGP